MPSLTFQDGGLVYRDGALGLDEACCCDGDCSCCDCRVYVVFDGVLQGGEIYAADDNDDPNAPEPCGTPNAGGTTSQQFDDAYVNPLTKCGTVSFYPIFTYSLSCTNSEFTLTINRSHACRSDPFAEGSRWESTDVLTFGCDGTPTLLSSSTTEIGDMNDCGNCGPNWADYEVFVDCNPLP